ncbi:hypothetical protein BJF79_04160 [Actinomadura sp. CNU-125]|uniref:hypothetical protein n=1 Tax=Actinomadura sp. CNU-125 TaxID=1904961 RepID=UPI00095E1DA3|nr:hypothetical protein [Actinomadura sp. CNU-125]OLT11994.1 hypothetical protein BJF79_04160 [Actinomadura sp. CNU-125]
MPADVETAEADDRTEADPEAVKTAKTEDVEKPDTEPEPETSAKDETGEAPAEDAKSAKAETSAEADAPGEGEELADSEKLAKSEKAATADAEGRARRRGLLVRAAVAVVLVAAVVTAGLQWYRADQAAQEEAARSAVKEQAGEFGQALLSYDHEHLQDARNRVLSLASEDFAKTYDVAFTGGLEGVITKLKADASATVRAVYLGDVDESTARAIVVMDSEVRSSAGTRRVLGSHLDMRLTLKDGQWRVTEVTSIGAAQETMTDPDGKQQGDGGGAAVPTPGASPDE